MLTCGLVVKGQKVPAKKVATVSWYGIPARQHRVRDDEAKVKKAMAKKAKKKASAKKAPPKKASEGCVINTTKKYTDRSSPPFPANECPEGMVKFGNDGLEYVVSEPNAKGVKRWRKLNRWWGGK